MPLAYDTTVATVFAIILFMIMITTIIMSVSSMHTPRLGMIRLTRRVPLRELVKANGFVPRLLVADGDGYQINCGEDVLYIIQRLPHCRRMKQGVCGDGSFEAWIEGFRSVGGSGWASPAVLGSICCEVKHLCLSSSSVQAAPAFQTKCGN